MRFIGNKENIIDKIYQIIEQEGVSGNSFFDFFSGTSNVAQYFKRKGYSIFSSDLMYFSYVLQKAYIENTTQPFFDHLVELIQVPPGVLFYSNFDLIIKYLNNLAPIKGFVYSNYTPEGTASLELPRMYFSPYNGGKIDAIRTEIEKWKEKSLVSDNEYFILLACLIETVPFYANISGVYAAFQKKWDPRAVKALELRAINIIEGTQHYASYNKDSTHLLDNIRADIFYLDPPYNQRQYAPNYHILETIAKYDNPNIYGVAGLREYSEQKSKFCNKKTAIEELEKIAKHGKYKFLILSYNSEGVMPSEEIRCTLSRYGTLIFKEFEYPRYKSNNNGESSSKKYIHEHLYILKR